MNEALMLRHTPDMDEQAFVRWQALLEARTGVHLPIARKSFLLLALSMRMRELSLDEYDAYLDYIQDGRHASFEWACLVDLLTVHDTRFFRNPESIELVRSFCRNALQHADADNKRNLTIWSVGCSTGEEVYSLVITLNALQQEVGAFYFGVTGTDISYPALATAREGIYHLRRLTGVSDEMREQCFQACGDDYFQVLPNLRQRTCFMQGNVLDAATMPKQQFDIIYCQNVLIYFQPERRRLMLNQIVAHLKPGGMVVLGPGEVLRYSHPQLTRLQHKHCLAFTHRGQHAQAE
jgi:chemotaxis protein methyltransferase CheR/type IV pilus assembly protein PilK